MASILGVTPRTAGAAKAPAIDFSGFKVTRMPGDFDAFKIEGQAGFYPVAIEFNMKSEDRVFVTFKNGRTETLDIDQMRQVEAALKAWKADPANDPPSSAQAAIDLVGRAVQLSGIKRAVIDAGTELSQFGDKFSGTEAQSMLDAALGDDKIDGTETGMILAAYLRASKAQTWTAEASEVLSGAVEAGKLSWSTEIWNIADGERILDGTPIKPAR
jgi:hypothetical protein